MKTFTLNIAFKMAVKVIYGHKCDFAKVTISSLVPHIYGYV